MRNRRKLHGLQSGITQNLLITAFVACAVAAVIFVGCQNDLVDAEGGGGGTGPQIPVARIVKDGEEPKPGVTYGDFQFELKWVEYEGAVDSEENIDTLIDIYKKWIEYEDFIDARPFFPPSGSKGKNYSVWTDTSKKLKNGPSTANMIIPRYWSQAWGQLTTATWPEHKTGRQAAFGVAKAGIEKQIEDIEKSGFYEVSYTEDGKQVFPLKELVTAMKDFIHVPASGLYTDRGPWENSECADGTTKLDLTKTGPLYERYFGHIPKKGEYLNEAAEYLVYPDPDPAPTP
jgi:hypothetical protein